jgi:ribosomal protein S18 acetylase RimI-like enzyme
VRIAITNAGTDDLEQILALQKLAYESEARLYNDWNIAPLTQSLSELQDEFAATTMLKAVMRGKLLGSVRAREEGDTCHIGRLIVHPEWQGQGIGSTLLRHVEQRFPHVECFTLFTGYQSKRNIHFYERLGYRRHRQQGILVWMHKANTVVNCCS